MGIGDLSQVEEIVCQYLTIGIHKLFTVTCPFSIGAILSKAIKLDNNNSYFIGS